MQSPQHVSLYPQDVRTCDGRAGRGDRSLAHRHERAQVSRPDRGSRLQSPGRPPVGSLPTPIPTSLLGKCGARSCGSFARSSGSPPGRRRAGVAGQAKGKALMRCAPLMAGRIPCSCRAWPYQYPPTLPAPPPFSPGWQSPCRPTARHSGIPVIPFLQRTLMVPSGCA